MTTHKDLSKHSFVRCAPVLRPVGGGQAFQEKNFSVGAISVYHQTDRTQLTQFHAASAGLQYSE